MMATCALKRIHIMFMHLYRKIHAYLVAEVYFCRSLRGVPQGAIVFFPVRQSLLCCGIAGIVSFKKKQTENCRVDIAQLEHMLQRIQAHGCESCKVDDDSDIDEQYLGGKALIDSLWRSAQTMKNEAPFFSIFMNQKNQHQLEQLSQQLSQIIADEANLLSDHMGRLDAPKVDMMSARIENLKDIVWCLRWEILENIKKTQNLMNPAHISPTPTTVAFFKKINAVLNSIDRLEVRGRDSAGISMLLVFNAAEFEKFKNALTNADLLDQFGLRCEQVTLVNKGIRIHQSVDENSREQVAVTVTYKVAVEVGSLGDNISYLRRQIANDEILQLLIKFRTKFDTISAHTRWASIGAITEPNCHPVDNTTVGCLAEKNGIIHTCLNGDIDNFQELKIELEHSGKIIPPQITTDTKIIPLQIQKYVEQDYGIQEAFRLAVNDFAGSHAISMHTDLAPGKMFLAQKGSGQAIFVGLADEHYMPISEVYGFIEETAHYLKLDGEAIADSSRGQSQGQIFILDQASSGGLDGIQAMYYDGTPIVISEKDINHTEINSRDTDRQGFPHYFLKEISESPTSIEKTLQNRWKIKDGGNDQHVIMLDQAIIPKSLQKALGSGDIKRIFFIGQGTAGVAALACANILNYYLGNPAMLIAALKASEFSGFQLNDHDEAKP
jgi:glucosamine--fructose-6-phosphate aminotransferase (isomerizing)